jgi:hypothetical protein
MAGKHPKKRVGKNWPSEEYDLPGHEKNREEPCGKEVGE